MMSLRQFGPPQDAVVPLGIYSLYLEALFLRKAS